MDETEAMTPPRDHDADTREFAPVIPLRRRQHDAASNGATQTLETDRPGIWDADAPLAGLTERPGVRDQPATEPLERRLASADSGSEHGEPDTPSRSAGAGSRHLSGPRRVQIAAACAVLAATAGVLAPAAPDGRRHATRAATVALPSAVAHAQTPTGPARATLSPATTVRHRHARHLAVKRVASSRPARNPNHRAQQPSRKLTARPVTLATTVHTAQPGVVSEPPPAGGPPARMTPPGHTQTASIPHSTRPSSSAASQCVPGELGC